MPRNPEDLARHRILHYDIGGGPVLRLADGRNGELHLPVRPQLVANNGDFLRDMALAGHGIIIIPSFIVWQALATGELVEVMPAHAPEPLNAWAVYPRNRYLSRRARLFIDFLAERFGEHPYWDQAR